MNDSAGARLRQRSSMRSVHVSVQEPNWASRRLHAGCRSGGTMTSPELIPEVGSTPGFGRRALLHLLHSCVQLYGRTALVTHDPKEKFTVLTWCAMHPQKHRGRVSISLPLYATSDVDAPGTGLHWIFSPRQRRDSWLSSPFSHQKLHRAIQSARA